MVEDNLDYFFESDSDEYPQIPSWTVSSEETRVHEEANVPRVSIENFYSDENIYEYSYDNVDPDYYAPSTQPPWNYLTIASITKQSHISTTTVETQPPVTYLDDTVAPSSDDDSQNLQEFNNTNFYRNASSCTSELLQASNSAYLYGIMFLMVVALLLNGLSIIIFRSKGLKRFAFSLYFVIIAVTDTLALVSYIPRKWLPVFYVALGFEEKTTFYDTNTIACKALTYLAYVLRFLSSWLLVALGSERLLVATTPYKRSRYPTLRSAKHGLAYCSVAAIIFNAHVLFIWDSMVVPGDETPTCVPTSNSQILALGLTILTVVLIIGLPFIVVSGLTIMVVRNFRAWKLRPRRLSSSVIARALFEKDATVMVVAVLGSYVLLCVPYIISWVVLLWQHFLDELPLCRYLDVAAARDVTEVGFMVNFSVKFLLCIIFGSHVLSQK